MIADADVVTELKTDSASSNQSDLPEETICFQLTEDGLLLINNHYSKACDLIRIELSLNTERTCAYFPSLI